MNIVAVDLDADLDIFDLDSEVKAGARPVALIRNVMEPTLTITVGTVTSITAR